MKNKILSDTIYFSFPKKPYKLCTSACIFSASITCSCSAGADAFHPSQSRSSTYPLTLSSPTLLPNSFLSASKHLHIFSILNKQNPDLQQKQPNKSVLLRIRFCSHHLFYPILLDLLLSLLGISMKTVQSLLA